MVYKCGNVRIQLLRNIIFLVPLCAFIGLDNVQACETPRNTAGACVIYNECNYVVDALVKYGNDLPGNVREFLLKSQCYETNTTLIHICCELAFINKTIVSRSYVPVKQSELIFTNTENFEAQLNATGVALLQNITCGVANTYRIAFGTPTRPAEFPWMALLRYDNEISPFRCGGSLITHRFVVTAAHCLVARIYKLIGVRLGEHDIDQDVDCIRANRRITCYTAEDFGIENTFLNPTYNRYRYINDVGLIKLDRDVQFKRNISPICLPLFNHLAQASQYPDEYVVTGWGTTENGEAAKILLKARLFPKPRSYCQDRFKKVAIESEHLCAGGDSRIDTCTGDSGGPLFSPVLYVNTTRFTLYGVVSFGGRKCGDENGYPGVYTNLVLFMPWITENINK